MRVPDSSPRASHPIPFPPPPPRAGPLSCPTIGTEKMTGAPLCTSPALPRPPHGRLWRSLPNNNVVLPHLEGRLPGRPHEEEGRAGTSPCSSLVLPHAPPPLIPPMPMTTPLALPLICPDLCRLQLPRQHISLPPGVEACMMRRRAQKDVLRCGRGGHDNILWLSAVRPIVALLYSVVGRRN